jgi:myo-inositol-1(or 4)-monophosphatase
MIDANQVEEIVRKVGAFIQLERTRFSKEDIEIKGKNDLVSYVDKQAEQMLVSELSMILPDAGFITEEQTVENIQKEYTWIIDPLDGTTNFIHGVAPYAISVGLRKGTEIIMGHVYELNRDEMFSAVKGAGAFLNNTKIKVSSVNQIESSLFSTGFPIHNFSGIDAYLEILNQLMKNCHGLRRMGSAATDLAYVACGRFEGFFEYNLSPWDVAAGILLVQEAGGTVTDFRGTDDYLFGRELIAAGPTHSALLSLIKNYWKA